MSFDLTKKPSLKHLMDVAERVNTELTPVKTRIKALEDVGAQANILEAVKVNGTAQAISDKAVDITVPTKASELENDAKYQTDTDVAAAVAAADHLKRKIVESTDAIDVEADDATQYIYMVLKSSTKAGDKYDEYMVIDGAVERVGDWTVDLSGYQQKEEGKGLSSNDFTDEEKEKLGKALTTDDMATDAEVAEMLDQVFGTGSED